jgi:hypothetical protein
VRSPGYGVDYYKLRALMLFDGADRRGTPSRVSIVRLRGGGGNVDCPGHHFWWVGYRYFVVQDGFSARSCRRVAFARLIGCRL